MGVGAIRLYQTPREHGAARNLLGGSPAVLVPGGKHPAQLQIISEHRGRLEPVLSDSTVQISFYYERFQYRKIVGGMVK